MTILSVVRAKGVRTPKVKKKKRKTKKKENRNKI